jgi:hypothetical protein
MQKLYFQKKIHQWPLSLSPLTLFTKAEFPLGILGNIMICIDAKYNSCNFCGSYQKIKNESTYSYFTWCSHIAAIALVLFVQHNGINKVGGSYNSSVIIISERRVIIVLELPVLETGSRYVRAYKSAGIWLLCVRLSFEKQ